GQSARIGIGARLFDFADDIKRTEFGNGDGDFRIFQIPAAVFGRELLLQLLLRQARRLHRARERQRDEAAWIDLIVAAERGFAIDDDADFLAGLKLRRAGGFRFERLALRCRHRSGAAPAARHEKAQEKHAERSKHPRAQPIDVEFAATPHVSHRSFSPNPGPLTTLPVEPPIPGLRCMPIRAAALRAGQYNEERTGLHDPARSPRARHACAETLSDARASLTDT